MKPFKKRFTLEQRIEKCKKQLLTNPDKIVMIVEKHPKSNLPQLSNPRFLCERTYKVNLIKSMLAKKLMQRAGKNEAQSSKNSFFVFINSNIPSGGTIKLDNVEETMSSIYDKNKDQDGFLYMQYSQMETS